MTFSYGYGYDLSFLRKVGESGPVVPRTIFTLGVGNTLAPGDVANAPPWFVEDDFILHVGGVDIEFEWVADHWETDGIFFTVNGNGTLVQGGQTNRARYLNATLPMPENHIVAMGAVNIVASNGVYITWSGP